MAAVMFSAACNGAIPSSPTPNVQGTITAAVAATVTATQATPTPQLVTSEELQEATNRAAFLTRQYQVPSTEVDTLTKMTYAAAVKVGLGSAEKRTTFHRTILDFTEHGGPALRELGIDGDPDSIAKAAGLGSGSGLVAFTPGQLVEIRTLVATKGLAQWVSTH